MNPAMMRPRIHGGLQALAAIALVFVLAACGSSVPGSIDQAGSGGGTVTPPDPPGVPDGPLVAASYVDQFVSTEDDFGQDLPGAYVPNGLAKVNPMSWPYKSHSGYNYPMPEIAGFTHTNLDGVGSAGGGGDLLVVPMKGAYTGSKRPALLGDPNSLGSLPYLSYAKFFSHLAEHAEPGYYQVQLLDANPDLSSLTGLLPGAINAEMTADTRSGWDRYTFPATAKTATLVLDLSVNFHDRLNASEDIGALPDGRASISGQLDANFNGSNYTLYYYAETTLPVSSVRTWGDDGALSDAVHQSGKDAGAILQFDIGSDKVVGLRITLSPISAEQARIDQANELGSRTFEVVRGDAYQQWNVLLSRVKVTASSASDPDGTLEKLFYTHLYKMFGTPENATSTTGTYRGIDGKIRQADGYVHYDGFSTWDDFHKYGVIALVDPQRYRDMARSMVDLFADLSHTDTTNPAALTNSVPTVRFERSAVVIADAVSKGVALPRLAEAYPALKSFSNGLWDDTNTALGYFPDHVADLLGTSYDDWALAIIARVIGKGADAAALEQRAIRYRGTSFNQAGWTAPSGVQIGLLWPKAADGTWDAIDPEEFGATNLYQGTLWQYNWYNPSDLGGLIQLMGGQDKFAQAASFFFGEQSPSDCGRMLHSNANEVDLIGAYLFDYAGLASHTQYWVRQIFGGSSCNRYIASSDAYPYALTQNGEYLFPAKKQVFQLKPAGFLPTMDNDAGTMSSMFVSAALGLFPAVPGSDAYLIGSPFFEKVTLPAGSGSFTISANGVTPDTFYIQSAQLAPCALNRAWIQYADIVSGGSLNFTMGAAASTWANDGAMPPSLSDSLPVDGFAPRANVEAPVCPQARS